jgi:hypothetical protein
MGGNSQLGHYPDAGDLACLIPCDLLLSRCPEDQFRYFHRPRHCGLRISEHALHVLLPSLVWRVVGPYEFLRDAQMALDGRKHLLERRQPKTVLLCRHEIRGD